MLKEQLRTALPMPFNEQDPHSGRLTPSLGASAPGRAAEPPGGA